ncbi:MAG: hypothetical protein JWM86_296, partial [Thermoleophilia bacterium]|nr:hypothetical protein [Thermoleophilia bacterium]
AAERAAAAAAAAATRRPHVLLDPDLASRTDAPKAGMPDMPAEEIADRIVATLLQGSGPILLCVPGTLGAAYQTTMLSVARAVVRSIGGPVSVASIPYPNGIKDVVTRFFHIGTEPAHNVLAHVLRKLHAAAPQRPILLTGESQGAWLIADTLREDPTLAAAVTRIAMFAKPGFVTLPPSIGSARDGAALLAATPGGSDGILQFVHTDDIVPSLFRRLGPHVLAGYVRGFGELLAGGQFGYSPHHYDAHGMEAARWLLLGQRPAADPVHESGTHPTHAPIA